MGQFLPSIIMRGRLWRHVASNEDTQMYSLSVVQVITNLPMSLVRPAAAVAYNAESVEYWV